MLLITYLLPTSGMPGAKAIENEMLEKASNNYIA
jgi:hypothetical protein